MFNIRLASATLFILIFFAACSSGPEVEIPEDIKQLENLTVIPPETEPSHAVEFNREAVYGETDTVIIGRIGGVAVDNDGRVFVADGDQNLIHAYEPSGNYLSRIGKEGEGPGEFTDISNLQQDEQYLYAYDSGQRRLNVFLLESLSFLHTIPLREDRDVEELSGAYPIKYYVRNDGKILVGYNQPFRMDEDKEDKILYYLVEGNGKIISDKLFEHRIDEFLMDVSSSSVIIIYSPFGRKSLFTSADDDKVYTAWTEDFLIKIYNPDGSYEKALYYPYAKSKLSKDEVIKINEYENQQRQMIRNADAPSTWPALNSFSVDDKNRIWVSTITDDKETYDWWLLSGEGELLARFTWPRNRSLVEVQNGNVYTRETDEETGLQQIVRYNVELL